MSKKRMMPVKSRTIELTEDWDGWQFTARTNPSIGVFEKLQSGDFGLICEALGETILDWNFVDESGDSLVSPGEARSDAKAVYRAGLNGAKPDRAHEWKLMTEAGAGAVATVTFDLVVKVSEALSEAIARPEGN